VSALKVLRMRGVQRPELDIIERQAGHLTRLVDDLLDVSRITRGKLDLRKRRLNVQDIVARALEIASPLVEERRIRVEVRLPPQLPYLYGDSDRLAQVVSNLVANAAKYSNPGSHVLIECRQAGDHVTLAVQDEGVGIPRRTCRSTSSISSSSRSRPSTARAAGWGSGSRSCAASSRCTAAR
jgi:signal transduction histidine kinase